MNNYSNHNFWLGPKVICLLAVSCSLTGNLEKYSTQNDPVFYQIEEVEPVVTQPSEVAKSENGYTFSETHNSKLEPFRLAMAKNLTTSELGDLQFYLSDSVLIVDAWESNNATVNNSVLEIKKVGKEIEILIPKETPGVFRKHVGGSMLVAFEKGYAVRFSPRDKENDASGYSIYKMDPLAQLPSLQLMGSGCSITMGAEASLLVETSNITINHHGEKVLAGVTVQQ
ncbi:MAG: hypothetical protein HN961_01130 [Planctomycetes bacterium]|jgi:hypothetical protein|nr:hypothetical protein [Planctomycetota bacterium]MBT7011492.1 hypothetical protein [Planctomycetota bacterium]